MKKYLIVLAGNRGQFEGYLNEHGLTDSQALYGWSIDVMRGVVASGVVVIGTFYDRNDSHELYDYAFTRVR